jgi:hypothetical protein
MLNQPSRQDMRQWALRIQALFCDYGTIAPLRVKRAKSSVVDKNHVPMFLSSLLENGLVFSESLPWVIRSEAGP